jgi:hypothetical protein
MSSNFANDLKRAMEDAANAGLKERGGELQCVLDRVATNAHDKPVDEVVTDLRGEWQQAAWDPLDDETVTSYARALSAGKRVIVQMAPVRPSTSAPGQSRGASRTIIR